MILTFDKSDIPNLIWLDAEQKRWVTPKRNLGKPLPENSDLRWMVTYQANEDWKGQLEASLINLKSTKLHTYHQVIRDLNDFLYSKEIDPNVKPGENRLQVILKNKQGKAHSIDELSAGEHQVMIQLYMVSRWLENGGIVLIDEPDLFLHPSLIPGFLSKLESLVKEKNGQLIITSHNPDIWKRYERKGLRVTLGGEDGLIAHGFQNALLDFKNAQDDTQIRDILRKWHIFLNPDDIFNKFQGKLELVSTISFLEQIHLWIDGKTFFTSHVHEVLNRLLGQVSENERKKQIFNGLTLPDDLEFLWEKFGL